MKLFDMHCDTPLELYLRGQNISDNDLHVSLKKAAAFEKYTQCAAIWSDASLSDSDCLERFRAASDSFKRQLSEIGLPLIEYKEQLDTKRGFILTVEGARLICGELDNIDMLQRCGVRIMTLVWSGNDSVGGAWNTDSGLTPLGHAIVEACLDTGIIPDISHGSKKLSEDVIDIMKKRGRAPLATHSNCLSVRQHPRNLDDKTIREICALGGICGISFCPDHLSDGEASADDIFRHIDRYIDLGGAKNVCFGCDFDGISKTPHGVDDISSMKILFDAACRRYGEAAAEDIFYNNAYNYMKNTLPEKKKTGTAQ